MVCCFKCHTLLSGDEQSGEVLSHGDAVSLSGVAAYVGWQSSSILKPLLQQGLSDAEEFVIVKALNALTCMCQLGLLQKPHVYEFASDIGKLLLLRLNVGSLGIGITLYHFI